MIIVEDYSSINIESKRQIKNLFNSINMFKSINKILLINPPDGDGGIFNYDIAKTGRYTNFAPYGLGVISEHLKKRGFETQILNLNHVILEKVKRLKKDDFDYQNILKTEIYDCIKNFNPDFVGLTCMFSMTHNSLKNIADIIKEKYKLPIGAGGVHISNTLSDDRQRDTLINDLKNVDYFFLFEAEIAFSEFIVSANQHFENMDLISQVLAKKDDKIVFFKNRKKPEGEHLNIIPNHKEMLSSELAQYGKVGNFSWLKNSNERITTILSNRGCRAQCTFCSVRNFNGVKVRQRSIQSVIDELIYLQNEHKINHVMWLDDDLLYNTKRTIELFNEMVKKNIKITWDASNGVIASSVTEEVMSAAEESGCIGLVIGMESGNSEILKSIKKPGTTKNFLEASKVLKKYPKINSRVFLMIGFPNENFGQILDTINVAREMNMDWNYITPLQPLPNTPIFDKLSSDNITGTESFADIKYFVGGGYASGASKESLLKNNFENIFKNKNLEEIPNNDEIKIIWAYMNYHLNFERLKNVNCPHKLEQNSRWMKYIVNSVAKNDPIALFYKILLDKKMKSVNLTDLNNFNEILKKSSEWTEKIKTLGLQSGPSN